MPGITLIDACIAANDDSGGDQGHFITGQHPLRRLNIGRVGEQDFVLLLAGNQECGDGSFFFCAAADSQENSKTAGTRERIALFIR